MTVKNGKDVALIGGGNDKKLIPALVKRINANWEKGTRAFLDVAKDCARAEDELTAEGYAILISQLKFDKSTCSKYGTIGRKLRSWSDHIITALPVNSFTSVYEVATMGDDQLMQGIAKGVIHPGATRDEIGQWKKSRSGNSGGTSGSAEAAYRAHATIKVPEEYPAESARELTDGLIELAKRCSAKLDLEETKLSDAGSEYFRKVVECVQRKARGLIKTRLKEGSFAKGTKKALSEETKITRDMSLHQVEANLQLISVKTTISDLLGEAYEEVEVPRILEEISREKTWRYSSGEEADGLVLNLMKREVSAAEFADFK